MSFKASVLSTSAFKLHTGNFPGLTFCTLFPNQEMGKSLSAQWGGDRTERLALGVWAWHRAPPTSQSNLGVGGSIPPALSEFPGRIQGVGLAVPPGRIRPLFLCPPKPGFYLGSWWHPLTRCDCLPRLVICTLLFSAQGFKSKPYCLSSRDHHFEWRRGSS